MFLYVFLNTALAVTPQDLANSMAVNSNDLLNSSLSADPLAVDVLGNLGIVTPTQGSDFAMLYTGDIGVDPQGGTDLGSYGESGDRGTFTLDLHDALLKNTHTSSITELSLGSARS